MLGFIARSRKSMAAAGVALAAIALLPVACKDSPTEPVLVVGSDPTIGVTADVAAAISGTAFNFPGQAAAIDPALAGQDLALTMNASGGSVSTQMSFSNGGTSTGSVTATTTFGSCIFIVQASTFPAGSKLAVGQQVVINPCNINVNASGLQATGVGATRSAALVLGSAASAGSSVTISVNPGGQLTLNGQSIGTVTLIPVSG